MEELLKQAYKVNKELKKELEKQEQPHFTSKKEKEKSKTASSSKSGKLRLINSRSLIHGEQ